MVFHWLQTVPFSQRITLLVVIVGLIASGFYSMVWYPRTNEIEMLEQTIIQTQQEIDLQVKKTSEFLRQDVQVQKIGVGEVSRRTIETAVLSPLLFREDVTKIAEHFELSLTRWQPIQTESNEKSPIDGFQIYGRFEGGYHQIAQSLAMILQLPWVLEIQHLRLIVADTVSNAQPTLVCNFQLIHVSDQELVKWPHSSSTPLGGV